MCQSANSVIILLGGVLSFSELEASQYFPLEQVCDGFIHLSVPFLYLYTLR